MQNKLKSLLDSIDVQLESNQFNLLLSYANFLKNSKRKSFASWDNDDQGLNIHFKDSLLSIPDIDGESLLDLGSGSGIPGIIYAIVLPRCQVTLLESQTKRCEVLIEVIEELNLGNRVFVCEGRAEELAHDPLLREKFDIVTARAFAQFVQFVEYAVAFVKENGFLHALRGESDLKVITENKKIIEFFSLNEISRKSYSLNRRSVKRYSIVFQKNASTLCEYPRSNNKIKKGLKIL